MSEPEPEPAVASPRSGPGGRLADPMLRAVLALGITQITAWGTSYYALGVLAEPIARDLGWSRGFVFLGFTVGVLVMAFVSPMVGRLIDARGARTVMSAGSLLIAAALAAISFVHEQWLWLVCWAFLGLGMRCSLYDAAFAALVQVVPSRGRQAISYLTLLGAFASSVFWVVGHYLEASLGWRETLLVFAALNLAVCLPLHVIGLDRREPPAAPAHGPGASTGPAAPVIEGRARYFGMALFALVMSLNGFVFGVVSVQLVPMLEGAGLAAATAVWIASLKGVAQFAGRVVEIAFGRNLSALAIGRISMAAVPASFVLFALAQGSFAGLLAFTLLMGGAQGVLTIVRGAVPLALFGAKGYGAVTGLIATPVLFVSAGAPAIFAVIVDRWGWPAGTAAVLAAAASAFVAMELMALWHRRHLARLTPLPANPA